MGSAHLVGERVGGQLIDLTEQLRQSPTRRIKQRLTFFSISGQSIARRAMAVVVLHLPAQFGAAAVAQHGFNALVKNIVLSGFFFYFYNELKNYYGKR